MKDPFDFVDVSVVQGDAGVLGVHDLLEDLEGGIIEIDGVDLLARDHDVVDGDRLQIQDAHEHLPVAMGDQRPGLGHDGAQLLAGQGIPVGTGR